MVKINLQKPPHFEKTSRIFPVAEKEH